MDQKLSAWKNVNEVEMTIETAIVELLKNKKRKNFENINF